MIRAILLAIGLGVFCLFLSTRIGTQIGLEQKQSNYIFVFAGAAIGLAWGAKMNS